ncbi:MAG: DUF4011 domain-containing protein [Planctomycetes bacterium]|nr:DUF4011 domain-containing protein [Planctomycetota bacterium]
MSVTLTQSPLGKPTMPFDPDARLAEWRKSLLDITKRNRLIKFAAGRIGGVYLLHPSASQLWKSLVSEGESLTFAWKREILGLPPEVFDADTLGADFDPNSETSASAAAEIASELTQLCLRSPHLRKDQLLTEFNDRQLVARLTRLFRSAKEGQSDHGVTTLYAAFGFLRWFESQDSEEEVLSPLLLVPVRLERETVESAFTLHAEEDEIIPNHCLAELLQTQFRIKLPTATESPLDPENTDCLANYLKAVTEKVKHVPRWGVVESAAIGVFNFQKLAMWEDLGRNAERVKAHLLCRAIAGDSAVSLKPPADLPAASDLDRVVPPQAALHILDADSSQHEAIEAVKRGANLVMDGPPGTGKSQTIANMIAAALAAGKTVLFVSEKTAALEVVKRRLDRCGMGDFCLELHSAKSNKKTVLAELGRTLEITPTGIPDNSAQLNELSETRTKLNEFVTELHAVRATLGWSAFRVHGELAKLGGAGRSRVAITDVFARDAEYVRRGAAILTGLADSRSVLEEPGGHPWRGCKITTYTHGAADEAKFTLTQLATAVPAVEAVARELAECGAGELPFTIRSWRAAEADGQRILATPLFPAGWFHDDPRVTADAIIALDAATRTARELTPKLPEFEPAAVRRFANPAELEWKPERERLTAALSARERHATLVQVDNTLRMLQRQVKAIEAVACEVNAHLRLPMRAFGQLGEIPALASRVASGSPIPLTWCDAPKRSELIAVVAGAAEDVRAAQADKAKLVTKLSAVAFAPESADFVREAATAASSGWRILPWSGWVKLRKQIGAWYVAGPPDDATSRADLAVLAAFHRRTAAAKHVATVYAKELFFDSSGAAAWDATANGLRDVATLETWKAASDLKTIAGVGGSLDRKALASVAERLTEVTVVFAASWSALLRDFAIGERAGILSQSPAELLAFLEAEALATGNEIAVLGRVVPLLAVGKDVPAAALPERLSSLRQLVEARARITTASAVLGDSRTPEALEATDHASDAEKVQALLAFLSVWARPITPQLAATLCESSRREQLRTALTHSETAHKDFDKAWSRVTAELFEVNGRVSTNIVLEDTLLAELAKWASARAADTERLAEWTRFLQVEHDAAAFGITAVLDEVKAGEFPATGAADAFRARFYRLWLDALHQQVSALAAFATDTHERSIERFAELDRLAIRNTPDRVRGQMFTDTARPRNRDGAPDSSELGVLLREVNKKRRHLPLRDLFRQIPTILPRLKPCLMMSPLAVSTYLDTPELSFDLVIFDEASQVRPHDAVCAIYRGKQLVVGGDPRQLPPTDFFNRAGDESDDADDPSAGYESLLDVCVALGLPRKRLRWHYRSRREGLIAFSNRYIYESRLVTFPSADEATSRAVTFVKVTDGRFSDGVNPVEAKQVAALVLEHARTQPDRSLGVIAFSQRQQDRILDELEVLRRQNAETEPFFADDRQDPFFVKNLENVQGDERDVILLSVGYGPDDTGKVAMRFGPLNRTGGERRLNVAVTRARLGMVVVSSMTAADIDLSRTSAEGAKMLKAFLDYAERGPVALAEAITEVNRRSADSPFEQEVGDELTRRGLTIHRQVGCGGYLIDMAITDPQLGGKYLLGVECDGATYHSAATARDRDRLRQSILEGLGWRLIRVWSSDWVRDRDKQVRRILAALEAAKKPRPEARREDPVPAPAGNSKAVTTLTPEYDNIEVVPEPAIGEAISAILLEFGSMNAEDLIVAVSKRLGFKRTGPKIRERITDAVNVRVSGNQIGVGDDGRVRLVKAQ